MVNSFQTGVHRWLSAWLSPKLVDSKVERNQRFLEEALELVQSCDLTQEDAHKLVDYVFNRPKGQIGQEIGGVMNTLAALCSAHGYQMDEQAEIELARCWDNIEKIKAKQKLKPKHSDS